MMEIKTNCIYCNTEIEISIFDKGGIQIINHNNLHKIEWYCEKCNKSFLLDKCNDVALNNIPL